MQDKKADGGKIKICYVITKGVWGGAQKYVYNLATSLPKDKYDVVVITGTGEVLPKKLEEKNIKVLRIESLRRDMGIVSEIKSFLKLLALVYREKPDVLHLNSPKAGGLGSVIGRILFIKKIIYTAHGWTFNEDRPLIQNTFILIFSWLTILLCHNVIVIAKREEEQAKNIPLVNPRKIIFIRNGIEEINFIEKEKARQELFSLSGTTFTSSTIVLGTISELTKNKGLEYTLDAVRKLKTPYKFFIIGNGEEKNKLENIIEKYELKDKVFIVSIPEKANLYLKAFDIFTLTSLKEGLPYVILEAGLAKVATIASGVGGIPEIIESGKSGILVTKARSGEITRAIEYLISKPEERKIFALNLNEKIEKDFSIEQMLEKTEKLYRL